MLCRQATFEKRENHRPLAGTSCPNSRWFTARAEFRLLDPQAVASYG
jgi:hypothetical protein